MTTKHRTAAVLFARAGSKSLPNKNRMKFANGFTAYEIILGHALQANCEVLVCSDDDEINAYAAKREIGLIHRPAHLADDAATLEDAISYAYTEKLKDYTYSAILLGNAPFVTATLIDASVAQLDAEDDLDSVATVGQFPMFAPPRARKVVDGRLEPYSEELAGDASCDRASHSNCYFTNGGLFTVRSKCLRNMAENKPPFRWMGKNIGYIEQAAGLGDIDEAWQIAVTECWLKANPVVLPLAATEKKDEVSATV